MNKSDFNVTHQNQSDESKIVASLERISQAFRVLLWQESKEYSLSPIQVQVLIFLLHHSEDKRKVSYLADEFNMTKATISDTIKTLNQKELITKEYEQHDSRSYIIHLTTKGKKTADKTSLFTQQINRPINSLKEDEKKVLLNSLYKIIYQLNQTGIISIQRMCLTCSYYSKPDGPVSHYCNLLNTALQTSELRIDCPEYVEA